MVGLVAVAWCQVAWAQQLHGYTKAAAGVAVHDTERVDAGARWQVDLSAGDARADMRAIFDLDLDAAGLQAGDRGAGLEVMPVELRVAVHRPAWDLTLGKQYVFWGVTDWVNPTDRFTTWDYAHVSSELEDYRVAPWAARLTGYAGASTADLAYVPFPIPDHVDLSGLSDEGIAAGDPALPARTPGHGDLGLRVSTQGLAGFDLSAMVFHGLDKPPTMVMEADLSTMPPALTLTPTHGLVSVAGGDLVRAFGPVLFKAEGAYTWTEDTAGTDPTLANPRAELVSGLSWSPGADLHLSVQGTWEHRARYDPDTERAALQALGDPDPSVSPTDTTGVVERIAWKHADTLTVSLVGVQGTSPVDHFELLLLSWRAAESLHLVTGAVLFGGPEGSRFGDARDDSRIFAELKQAW